MPSTGDMSPEAQAIQEMIREEQGPDMTWPQAANVLTSLDHPTEDSSQEDWEEWNEAIFMFETEAPYCCGDEQAPILGVLGNTVHHQCLRCGLQLTTGGNNA